MKNYISRSLFVGAFSLLSFVGVCSAQDKTEELQFINFSNTEQLMLDGEALDHNKFNLSTRGKLSLVSGISGTNDSTALRFNIFLKRDGEFVPTVFSNLVMDQAELEEVLKLAVTGDQILIVPFNMANWQSKLVLKLVDGC